MKTHSSIYLQVKQLGHLNGLASQHQAIKTRRQEFQAQKTLWPHFSDPHGPATADLFLISKWPVAVNPLTKYKPI